VGLVPARLIKARPFYISEPTYSYDVPRTWWTEVREFVPHALIELGLIGGLLVIGVGPFPGATLNYLVGGALLVVALVSVTHLIILSSESGGRKPDF